MEKGRIPVGNLSSWKATGELPENIRQKQERSFLKAHTRQSLIAVDPPDGGWGWFVNFASFLVTFIVYAIRSNFSILFPEFLKEFGAGAGSTSWIASIERALSYFCGPLVAVLSKKYGIRNVVVRGSVLALIGLLSSVFANSVIYMTITYGVFLGIANCATLIPSMEMLGRYFRLKLPIAQGLKTAGTGLGSFIMPPFAYFLNYTYGWRGTLLLVSGLSLHTLVAACLLRPIYLKSDEERQQLHATRRASQQLKEVRRASLKLNELRRASQQLNEVRQNGQHLNEMGRVSQDLKEDRRASQQLKEVRRASQQLAKIRRGSQQFNETSRASMPEDLEYSLTVEELLAFNKKRRSSLKVATDYVKATAYYSFDIQLFKNKLFLTFIITFVFWGIGGDTLTNFVYVHAVNSGIENSRASFLLSVHGMTMVLASLLQGFVLNRIFPNLNQTYAYITSFMTIGLSLIALAFANQYASILVCTAVNGISCGIQRPLYLVVIKQIVGDKYLTSGIGMSLPFYGIGLLVGPPIQGYLYDITGSYTTSFCVAGSTILLGVVIIATSHCCLGNDKKKAEPCLRELDGELEHQSRPITEERKMSTVQFDLSENNKRSDEKVI